MQTYTVTDPNITIAAIHIGDARADLAEMYALNAEHPDYGRIDRLPIYCFHLTLPGRSVLVDAGLYEFPTDAAQLALPEPPPPGLLQQLADAGVPPDAITDVIITHAHFDHFNAVTQPRDGKHVPTFPQARHYLGRGDWDPNDPSELIQRTLGILNKHHLLTLIDGEHDLGDGLTLVPTPGETPGHQVLRVAAGGESYYFAGDLFHHPLEFTDETANVTWADPEVMRTSKRRFTRTVLAEGAGVFLSHVAGLHRLTSTPGGVEWTTTG